MSHRAFAAIFGIAFLAVGILGFVPAVTPNGYLLNIFEVNTFHNSFHILTGIVGLLVAVKEYAARMYFKIFGSVYLFLAALGILLGGRLIFMHLNLADHVFHLIVAAIALYLGFGKLRYSDAQTLRNRSSTINQESKDEQRRE